MRREISGGRFVVGALPPDGVSVVVVSYPGAPPLESCVAALRRAVSGVRAELIIVAGSGGGTSDGETSEGETSEGETSDGGAAEDAQEVAPDARVVKMADGGGFAEGCHAGVALAKGQWLVFVNPETLPAPGSVRALLDCAHAEPQAGIVGGRCVAADGSTDPRSWWGRPGLWSAFCFGTLLSSVFPGTRWFDPEAPRPWSSEVQQVPVVSGGFMLVSRRAWEDTGGFDRGFFMYGEDADLCLRASALGYRPTITGRAVFRYVGGAPSIGPDKLVMLFTGKATLMRRHVGKGAVRLLLLGVFLRAKLGRLVGARPAKQGRPATNSEDWRRLWELRREWSKGWPQAESGSQML